MLSLWTPVGAFMALLYYLSSRTDLGDIPAGSDKVVHALAYTVLGLLAARACHGGLFAPRAVPAFFGVLLTVGYAALDELHQGFVPGRHMSLGDWVADAVGAVLGLAALALLAAGRRAGSGAEAGEALTRGRSVGRSSS